MKYYSEELKALFNSKEELVKAEADAAAKKQGNKKAIEEIIALFDNCIDNIDTACNKLAEISDLSDEEEDELMSAVMKRLGILMHNMTIRF